MHSKKALSVKAVLISALSAVLLTVLFGTELYAKHRLSTVRICGRDYERTVTEIDLSGSDLSGEIRQLSKLSCLEYADLTSTGLSPRQIDILSSELPGCRIKWSVPLGVGNYSSDTRQIRLTEDVSPSELKKLRYFTELQTLDARGYPLCDELYSAVKDNLGKDARVTCLLDGSLYGEPVDGSTVTMDLSGKTITDLGEFYSTLRFFPDIREIYVGDIGVPDEDVDRLNKAFPGTKIVWLVEFGRWQARTDLQVFSTLIGVGQRQTFDENELYPLLAYCTELKALDLGHNHMTNLDLIGRLTRLQLLIVAENHINTIEPLGNLKDLEFLEVYNCGDVEDLSPLGRCPNLEWALLNNIGEVKNISALANCKKLKLLYVKLVKPVDYTWQELQSDLPECTIDRHTYVTKGEWRESERGHAVRVIFHNWTNIKTFNHWDD